MHPCSELDRADAGLAMQFSNAISVKRAITDWTKAFCCSAITSSSNCPMPPPPPMPINEGKRKGGREEGRGERGKSERW
jgi:hypothetical protein